MLVYVATSLDLSWFLELFGSTEKETPICDHGNKVDESNSSRGYILFTILIALVLLKFYWTGENKEINSNINEADDEEEEPEYPADEHQLSHRASEHRGASPRNVIPCAFCGNSSTTRCARCKVARYCSGGCQIEHWRSWHRYECIELESEKDEARNVDQHQTHMLVDDKYDNENIRNVEMNVSSSSSSVKNCESDVGCEQCGRPSTTKCSRCKSVGYCSTKCLITNWRWHKYNCTAGDANSAQPETPNGNVELLNHSNEEQENIHSPRPLYLELHPVTTTTNEAQVHKTQWGEHIEDELVKSRKENLELRSERDEWKKRASFARERFQSFKEESEKQIAAQDNIAEKRKLEKHIQMVESECTKLKKELEEQHKDIQYLTLESNRSHEMAQIAIREVEAIKQELIEERENVERIKANFTRDITFSNSKAIVAEAKLSDLQRKIKLREYKACTICLTNEKDMAFGCGHMTCRDCGSKLSKCPICREQISSHIKLFSG
ncbi:uncharacterized protein LOC131620280 isoform X1 [Vicia villosa]|uniref:uncharacterized protein LOC131620280 isoform X1 n=1 Tax=Vicia villosa TaxID=3911 RepID=UPI00273B450D|nr:uncharacterized protein LOC131620280 isoform X1 [Vicia villosa]